MAAYRRFEFHKLFISQRVTVLEQKFDSAHEISSKSDDSRPRYSDKPFSKWRPSAMLNFQNLVFFSVSARDSASSHKISR